jgi:hypothetical protein
MKMKTERGVKAVPFDVRKGSDFPASVFENVRGYASNKLEA